MINGQRDPPLPNSKTRLALAVLCHSQFVVVLGFQGTAVVLPQIESAFDLSKSSSQWLISVNALTFGGLLLPAGRAADTFGHRRLFLIGTILFAASSIAAGLAQSAEWLIAARGLQGAATAMFAPAAYALLTETFGEGTARRKAIAIWTAAGPIGGIAAIMLGGLLAEALGWRAVFLIGAVAVLPSLLLTRSVLKEAARQPGSRINPMVALAGIAGIGHVVYALGSIPSSGAIPIGTDISFAIGLAMIALFVIGERRSESPIVPKALFQQSELRRPIIGSFFHGASTNTWIFFYSIYLQQMRDVSPWVTGLAVVPCNIAVITGTACGGRLGSRFGHRKVMAVGLGIAAVGLFGMTTVSLDRSWLVALIPGMILIGFGLGLAQVGFFEMATEHSAAEDRGSVGAGINAAAQIGTAIGLAILVVSSAWFGNEIDQIRFAFAGGGLIAVAGVLTVLFLPGDAKRDNPTVSTRRHAGAKVPAKA